MSNIYQQSVLFAVMFVVAMLFNPMSMLAYQTDHLYFSTTLLYASGYMASTMIWAHQIVHFFQMNHFNWTIFTIGILMSLLFIFLLRTQMFVTSDQWLRRMIPHHSTALTTTTQLLESPHLDDRVFRLAKDIVYNQRREIKLMKLLIE
jgi:hypothetical protein